MSKKETVKELTTLLALGITHKIGSIVNKNQIYTEKYAKESNNFINQAKKVSLIENWNNFDKNLIKQELRKKLLNHLTERTFLDNEKFDLVEDQINSTLTSINLN